MKELFFARPTQPPDTLVAMEPPASHQADSIRSEKLKVLKALRPVAAHSLLAKDGREWAE